MRRETRGRFVRMRTRGVFRPNKLAVGMMETIERTRERGGRFMASGLSYDARVLAVHGTLDKLARGFGFEVERLPCRGCGGSSHGKLRLNDAGRARLARARQRKG